MALLGSTCPGSKLFKDVKPEYMVCPHCDREIEMWTDELAIRCPHCQLPVRRDRGASCIDWCQYAKECIGAKKFEQLRRSETAPADGARSTDAKEDR